PVSTLAAVESAARDAGYTALVATMSNPDLPTVVGALESFMERGVEGIVVIAPRVPMAHVEQGVTAPTRIAGLAPGQVSARGITVSFEEQELGARLATRNLIHLGHREIAPLAGNQDWLDGQVRRRGWQAELAAHKIPAVAV